MSITRQYPIDLKQMILAEYQQGKVGYKTLANKYGLKRDTVRSWVLKEKSDSYTLMNAMNKDISDEKQKDIEYYKTAAEYWKLYAQKLEEVISSERKKKQQSKQSRNCKNEETE